MLDTAPRTTNAAGLSPASLMTIGAVSGLAWAAGLRGLMAEIVGADSGVDWIGTFVWVLLPGLFVGLLLGWAEHLRRTGGRHRWRWLAWSPLVFSSVVVSNPGILGEGLGVGALAVPLFGMAGGYALSSRAPIWARLACALFALLPVPAWAFSATLVGPGLALDTARGAWVAMYYWTFLAVLAFACSIPHREVIVAAPPTPVRGETLVQSGQNPNS